jgi:hypothetical protein
LSVGDRVCTPRGPGTVVAFHEDVVLRWPHALQYVVVEFAGGQRRAFRPNEVEPDDPRGE